MESGGTHYIALNTGQGIYNFKSRIKTVGKQVDSVSLPTELVRFGDRVRESNRDIEKVRGSTMARSGGNLVEGCCLYRVHVKCEISFKYSTLNASVAQLIRNRIEIEIKSNAIQRKCNEIKYFDLR